MINNSDVIKDVVSYLEYEINSGYAVEKKKIERRKKNFVLQKKTPWGQVINPRTTIGKIAQYSDYGVLFSTAMGVIILSYSFLYSLSFIDPQLAPIGFEKLKNTFTLFSIPLTVGVPSYAVSSLKKELKNEEKDIKNQFKDIEKTREEYQKILDAIKCAYDKSYSSADTKTIMKDFLEKVDLTGNSEIYNVNLLLLLANATNFPNPKTFHELTTYLRETIEFNRTDPDYKVSSDFLENDFVGNFARNR